jgi:hypothetical protein
MKTVYLVSRTDDEYGTLGLVAEGPTRDGYNVATEGFLIAHDLIEHQNGLARIGDIDDELEALGAIWIVRGQHGDISRNGVGAAHSPEENIASDLSRMCVDVGNGAYFPDAQLRTRPHDDDDVFREIIEIARREALAEIRDGNYGTDAKSIAANAERYFSAALHYMRRGARKCARRYAGQFSANSQFWAIAEAIDPHAAHVEYEGQRYRLRYGKGEATCEEVYDDENY